MKVWAGVSATGKTKLHFYEGTIEANKCKNILTKALPEMREAMDDEDEWCFQHDEVSAHKANHLNKWLEDNVPCHITSGPSGDWPGNLPDLDWIEKMWAWMDDKLEENSPQTIASLKRRLKKIWKDMPQNMFYKMAPSMKNGCKM